MLLFRRIKTLLLAAALGVVALITATSAVNQSGWLPAAGKVISVSKTCKMEAKEYNVLTRTTYSKELDCGLVEAFKVVNAGKDWHMTLVYSGQVDVKRGGVITPVVMTLQASGKREPTKGDTLSLLQNPADPRKVTLVSSAANTPYFAIGAGAGSAFLFWLGFGTPLPRRREALAPRFIAEPTPTYAAPPPVIVENSRARNAIAAPRRTFGRRA